MHSSRRQVWRQEIYGIWWSDEASTVVLVVRRRERHPHNRFPGFLSGICYAGSRSRIVRGLCRVVLQLKGDVEGALGNRARPQALVDDFQRFGAHCDEAAGCCVDARDFAGFLPRTHQRLESTHQSRASAYTLTLTLTIAHCGAQHSLIPALSSCTAMQGSSAPPDSRRLARNQRRTLFDGRPTLEAREALHLPSAAPPGRPSSRH